VVQDAAPVSGAARVPGGARLLGSASDRRVQAALRFSQIPGGIVGEIHGSQEFRRTGIPLPSGITITGRDGYVRETFRTKFWAINPRTYRDVVFQPDPLPDELANRPLSPGESEQLLRYPPQDPPVFVGHYWLQGRPRPLCANVACLDYSAVKFGRLAAYRFDGESRLSADKFVWVYVDPDN
jgi:hypothetical protein